VRNIPPVGDNQWRLFDIRKDPGETTDLQAQLADQFRSMQDDYAAYAASHGVLPMPDGYDPVRQVLINSFLNYWIPAYRNTVLAWSAGLLALFVLWRLRRRRKAMR